MQCVIHWQQCTTSNFNEIQSMLGFIPVQNFIGKGTKADSVTNMMIISASGFKQRTSLKVHICWDVMLCCSPNGTAARMLRHASSPTPLLEPYLLQQITC
jgi:hypothetical protein